MMQDNDTIVALSTPSGEGGLAVIRLSGIRAVETAGRRFRPDSGGKEWESHRAYHGWIRDGEEPIDEVVVTIFRAPRSYTGEDVVEISCHGGRFVSRRIVELMIGDGARPARPGEFTERAYLNGKMDLAQAEAVADLIRSRTEASRRVAAYQLEGRLSEELDGMRSRLIQACSLLELELDFGEEDVSFASREELAALLEELQDRIGALLVSYRRGRVCREGVRMVILGKPNVGKSSLLNRMVQKERAIVTEHPGTTRDTVEESLDIGGVLFTITDTAGIHATSDPVESEGVRRSEAALDASDLVLLVLDGSLSPTKEDEDLIRRVEGGRKTAIVVLNKDDLGRRLSGDSLRHRLPEGGWIRISAVNGRGVEELIGMLEGFALHGELPQEGEVVLTSERHRRDLTDVEALVKNARESLNAGLSQEFIALDLRGALDALGRIIGKTTADDVLDSIFSRFCIGK